MTAFRWGQQMITKFELNKELPNHFILIGTREPIAYVNKMQNAVYGH